MPRHRSTQFRRVVRFGAVGFLGAVVNTVVLYALYRWLGVPLLIASILAVELAVVSNYFLNDRWTFASHAPSVRRFAKFNVSSLGGLVINVAVIWLLVRARCYLVPADLAGIVAGFAVNFGLSATWVWGGRI